MKVIGTGNPEMLTLRLRERELAGLKEDLGHRASVADDAEVTVKKRGFDAPIGSDGRTSAEILAAVTALLDRLATAQPNEQGRVVVSGPTWLLGPAIRGATAEAAEQLVSALERFIIERLSPMAQVEKIRSSFALKQVRYKTALPLAR